MNGDKEQELLREARLRFEATVDFDRQNRDDALDDLKFMAGEQWPEAVKQARESDSRPVLTINRLPQFVRQVTGDMKQNRPAIRVRPVDDEADAETADVATGLIRHIEQASSATRHYTRAGAHAVSCGIGHFRIVTRYAGESGDEQELAVASIRDPLSVYWDPDASEETREDARYCFVTQWYTKDAFEATWPKATPSDWQTADTAGAWQGWIDGDRVRVAEYWLKRTRKANVAEDGVELESEDAAAYKELGGTIRREDRVEIVQYIMTGDAVLEGPTVFPGRSIPIVPVIGEEIPIGDRVSRHGLIRYAKDAQRMYNYARSAQVEAGALQPKAPFMATTAMLEGHEAVWKTSNTKNYPVLPYNPDPNAPGMAPQRMSPPVASQAWAQEIAQAAEDMKATTGIYDASLGNRSNETSGVAIRQRQMEGDTGTFVYIDNLARSIEYAGKLMIEIIPIVYDTDRVVRVLGEDDAESTARINAVIDPPNERSYALGVGRYDVVVDVGPGYQTKRQESAESMQQFIQSMPNLGVYIADLYVSAQDWPDKDPIRNRIRKMMARTVPGLLDEDEMPEGVEPPKPQGPSLSDQAGAAKNAAMAKKYEADAGKAQAETMQILQEMQASIAALSMQITPFGSVNAPPGLPPPRPQQQNAPMQSLASEPGFFMPTEQG